MSDYALDELYLQDLDAWLTPAPDTDDEREAWVHLEDLIENRDDRSYDECPF